MTFVRLSVHEWQVHDGAGPRTVSDAEARMLAARELRRLKRPTPRRRWLRENPDLLAAQIVRAVGEDVVIPGHGRFAFAAQDGVPDYLRVQVLARDGARCRYCSLEDDLTIDHVVPRTKGGLDLLENLVVACRRCNSEKSNRDLDEFLAARV